MSIVKTLHDHRLGMEEFEVFCDACNSPTYFEIYHGWAALMVRMKAEGWVSKKKNGEWVHFCNKCSTERKPKASLCGHGRIKKWRTQCRY